MKNDFDHIAKDYDSDFTHSEIGKLQRKAVYKYLESLSSKLTILELNCGTGEDALWFSKRGNQVLATDISKEMIAVARLKGKESKNISFQQLDINTLNKNIENKKFDLIFSNFGGLNCLNKQELEHFFISAKTVLNKNGKMILVIMPKNTLWERFYFILKGQFSKISRRNTEKPVHVNVEGKEVETWYFNPKDIKNLSSLDFKILKTKPIGFFVPPSYLEPFFVKSKRFLAFLGVLEEGIGKFGFLSRFSDHYIIELQIK